MLVPGKLNGVVRSACRDLSTRVAFPLGRTGPLPSQRCVKSALHIFNAPLFKIRFAVSTFSRVTSACSLLPSPSWNPTSQVQNLHETYPAEGGLVTYIERAKELLAASQVRAVALVGKFCSSRVSLG